jgi:hypothetical protein
MKPFAVHLITGFLFALVRDAVAQFDCTTNGSAITVTNYTGSGGVVAIPNFVTAIGQSAFKGRFNITRVTLPEGVTTIEDYAFEQCVNLTNLDLPNTLVHIGGYSFYHCYNLASLNLPNSVVSLGPGAFFSCGLVQATVGTGLQTLGNLAFSFCTNLVSVYFEGLVPYFGNGVFDRTSTLYCLPGMINEDIFPDGSFSLRSSLVPMALWTLPNPLILSNNSSFGLHSNAFGFTVSWATNRSVVVEACTNLSHPVWQPILTNTTPFHEDDLSDGAFHFSDPQSSNYPARFYRARSL